ncbi:hypothetical protein G6O69_28955 [Pseudenhygromyxa sp. WMMC2535]|uniref:hypothetical protein n=1 Tax=Pseudenhygromyxa sp. WMMC2535 TaxID=2712867 RepID=UPI001557C4F4|nr:hypothetical protein [Pseudenhygromyxa sp. WMMC2535]NVB41895.1 hypothetical protein [Pseudenhygromyxa sp. WMMC2535]
MTKTPRHEHAAFALAGLLSLCLSPALGCSDDGGSSEDEIGDSGTASESESESASEDESASAGESGSSSSESDSGDTTSSGESDSGDTASSGESDSEDTASGSESSGEGETDSGDTDSSSETTGGSQNPLWNSAHLWYSIDDQLIYIEIDPSDGSVVNLSASTITADPPLVQGQSGITILLDDQDEIDLLLTRVSGSSDSTAVHHIHAPPTDGSPVAASYLGDVPDDLLIEALYTDCQGLVYLMDTGPDVTSSEGNRLIRFTGDYLGGDLSYEVITDLENASVADIDDMGPGIDAMGEITDGQGFAIDSGSVYDFDYNTGTGSLLGQAGTYGVHALGGPLFDDLTARLYVLDIDGNLYEADPVSLSLSPVLITGPNPDPVGVAGWSGLAGPLTECETTLPEPQ